MIAMWLAGCLASEAGPGALAETVVQPRDVDAGTTVKRDFGTLDTPAGRRTGTSQGCGGSRESCQRARCLRGHREFAAEDSEFECFPFAPVEHENRPICHGAVANVCKSVCEPDLDAVRVISAAVAALEPLVI
jgi:hypothetical protein